MHSWIKFQVGVSFFVKRTKIYGVKIKVSSMTIYDISMNHNREKINYYLLMIKIL